MLVGLVFGLLAAGILGLPLGAAVPARAVSGWFYVTHDVALLATVSSLLLPSLAGFVAAWLDPDDPIRGGAGAGMVSALLAGTLVVMPASQIAPATDLLVGMAAGSEKREHLLELLALTIVDAQWFTTVGAISLLVVAPGLGAIGGLVHDLWQGRRGHVAHLVHRSSVPLVAAWVVLASVTADLLWTAHVDVSLLQRLGHATTWMDRARLTSVLATAGVAQSLLLAWMLRDALLLFRARRRLFGLVWLGMALAPSALTGVAALVVHPLSATTPGFWVGGVAVATTVLGTLVVHWRSEAELHERPRTFWDLMGEGAAMGVVCVSLGAFTGLTPVAGTRLLVWPLLGALTGGTPLDMTQIWLVGRLYLAHLGSMGGMVAVGIAYAMLATPVWLVVRAMFVRATSRRAR